MISFAERVVNLETVPRVRNLFNEACRAVGPLRAEGSISAAPRRQDYIFRVDATHFSSTSIANDVLAIIRARASIFTHGLLSLPSLRTHARSSCMSSSQFFNHRPMTSSSEKTQDAMLDAPENVRNDGVKRAESYDRTLPDSTREPERAQTMASETDTLDTPDPTKTDETITRDFRVIPIPKYLRYDPNAPTRFDIFLNILFGVASTFGQPHFL